MDKESSRFTEIQTYISIIVPVYNGEKYLNRCVDSILNQTFKNFELILVNDGSTDNSGKICDEYKEKDRRVRVIHKPNGGRSDAKNAGIDLAFSDSDSEWIAFIDCDDWIHPRYLEFLLKAAIESNASISTCEYTKTKELLDFPEFEFKYEMCSTEDFWINHNLISVVPWGKLCKKKDFANIRYPFGKEHEDEFTTYKILFKYDSLAFVNEELYYYFTNPSGIMNSEWTPRRLCALEAVQSEIDFFETNGMIRLRNFEIKVYLSAVSMQIKRILSSDDKLTKRKYLKFLRKELRWRIRRYSKIIGLTLKNDAWIYECAYPKLMWLYWAIKAQIAKIKK